jgi:hypothetical protein
LNPPPSPPQLWLEWFHALVPCMKPCGDEGPVALLYTASIRTVHCRCYIAVTRTYFGLFYFALNLEGWSWLSERSVFHEGGQRFIACWKCDDYVLLLNFPYMVKSEVLVRDSALGIATLYRLDGPVMKSRWWRSFLHPSWPTLRPIQPLIQRALGLLLGGKAARVWR